MKTYLKTIEVFILMMVIAVSAFSVQQGSRGPTEAVMEENQPEFVEIHRIKIINEQDGEISVSRDKGKTWDGIGKVLVAATQLNDQGYSASGWALPGKVAATAVNAIHIKVRQNGEKGVVFSLLPGEFFEKPKDYKSYYAKSSSIITDIPAGEKMFGGKESPFIGSPVYTQKGEITDEIGESYSPSPGDEIVIIVERPVKYPAEIVFENRFGGFITVKYDGEKEKIIGQVLKPVAGVGRFDGSLFAGVGRLRANHTGVICISTSQDGAIGGFQIIPDNHGMSKEMSNARLLTQWMVVGPKSVDDPSLEGVAPLFSYFLRPVYAASTADGRTIEDMLGSLIVDVRIENGQWQRMPDVTGRVDDAMKNVTHVRILFPLHTPEWMK